MKLESGKLYKATSPSSLFSPDIKSYGKIILKKGDIILYLGQENISNEGLHYMALFNGRKYIMNLLLTTTPQLCVVEVNMES